MCAAANEAAKSKDCPAEKYRKKRWVEAFEACDENNKGYLNREDYKVAIVMLFGYKPSKVEVDSVMASVKQNPFGLSLEEFLNLMTTKKVVHFYHSEIRRLFMSFDRQCRGFLSFEDFKKAFSIVAPKLPERIIVEAFRAKHTVQMRDGIIKLHINKRLDLAHYVSLFSGRYYGTGFYPSCSMAESSLACVLGDRQIPEYEYVSCRYLQLEDGNPKLTK